MEADKNESSSNAESSKSIQSPEVKEEAKNIDEQTRLWAAVKEKPSDFTSWTRLLQLVEQKVLLNLVLHVHSIQREASLVSYPDSLHPPRERVWERD